MPYCPNPDCPHRLSLGEPAEYNKGVTVCADCGSKLAETVPHFAPIQKKKQTTLTGWACPECGATNPEEISKCLCDFDSNRPFITDDNRAKPVVTEEMNKAVFGGPVELSKYERKFAEISAKKYNRFLYRHSLKIGWIGAILFSLGILHIPPLSSWGHTILVQIGFFTLISSTVTFAMTVAGKLYINLKVLEKSPTEKKD
jgi:DNA-directed RNA polymerase subunit RPC12/RpoP